MSAAATLPAPPATFRASCGRRPDFLSPGDAAAYERGWHAYPTPLADVIGAPAMKGWFDAEAAHIERLDARLNDADARGHDE